MMSLLKFRVLTSLSTSRVRSPSPWAGQNFPASLKVEQILSHRYEKGIIFPVSTSAVADKWDKLCIGVSDVA